MSWDAGWLPCRDPSNALDSPKQLAQWELDAEGIQYELHPHPEWQDEYQIQVLGGLLRITGGASGILYGAYRLLLCKRLGVHYPLGIQKPAFALRMLDHWDNLDGSVERGYAGRSLFFESDHFRGDVPRLRAYARLLASVGINTICINNVNVASPAQELIGKSYLPEVATLAELFAPFGIGLILSVDFSMPLQCGVPTADPLDAQVIQWWQERVALVYHHVPTLRGFLVKADSEGRPGPYAYGRNHAQGANLLANALKPHGGILVWRCFVYNCKQDWRDTHTDRPMAAHQNYADLDGTFADNVMLQIKHGPFDFQVREPPSPLLYAMPHTHKALELQLTQEYTGQQIDLYAMQGMWHELLDDIPIENIHAIAAVANTGRNPYWTGHPFAQLNLFAYGCVAWQPSLSFEAVTQAWIRLTYGLQGKELAALQQMLFQSRAIYERYTAPLGLCWMVNPGHHYGPSPMGYEYSPWGTYHRASHNTVGIDRTAKGTGYILQYPPSIQARYVDPATCPPSLLLFFHRLRYDHRMQDGRTLIQRIYDDHYEGAALAEGLLQTLYTLEKALPHAAYQEALRRMALQVQNAREWRDVLCDFFHRLSGIDDDSNRL